MEDNIVFYENISKALEELKSFLEDENNKINNKYMYQHAISCDETKEITIKYIVDNENTKLEKIRYNPSFITKIDKLRNFNFYQDWLFFDDDDLEEIYEAEKFLVYDESINSDVDDDFVNVKSKLGGYENSHKKILAIKDNTFQVLRKFLEVLFGEGPVNISRYVIMLYYIFFNKWIDYNLLVDLVMQKYPWSMREQAIENTSKFYFSEETYSSNILTYDRIIKSYNLTELIDKIRAVLDIKISSSTDKTIIDNIKYYHYLLEYYNYVGMYDEFLKGILFILEEFDIFNYKSELDYLLVLNFIINNNYLKPNELKEELSTIVAESYPGIYFDEKKDFDRDALYFKLLPYADTQYIQEMMKIMNSAVIEFYSLNRNEQKKSKLSTHERNKVIAKIFFKKKQNGMTDIEACETTYIEFNKEYPGVITDDPESRGADKIFNIMRKWNKENKKVNGKV